MMEVLEKLRQARNEVKALYTSYDAPAEFVAGHRDGAEAMFQRARSILRNHQRQERIRERVREKRDEVVAALHKWSAPCQHPSHSFDELWGDALVYMQQGADAVLAIVDDAIKGG